MSSFGVDLSDLYCLNVFLVTSYSDADVKMSGDTVIISVHLNECNILRMQLVCLKAKALKGKGNRCV